VAELACESQSRRFPDPLQQLQILTEALRVTKTPAGHVPTMTFGQYHVHTRQRVNNAG
jgi:hypothetical protein